jgi:hypothetical protein
MIQIRLDPAGQTPDLAVYAQHTHAGQRPWNQVERVGDQPVVYPARGSHASYFNADVHWTGDWFDFADGKRQAPPLQLHVISDDAGGPDGWAIWPGMWGGTKPGGVNPLDDSSPRGPGGHDQYQHPEKLLQTATEHIATLAASPPPGPPIPAPTIAAAREGEDLQITYATHVANPAGLVVTIGDTDDPSPPAVYQIPVDAPSGVTSIPGAAAAGPLTVQVSTATQEGAASPSTETTVAGTGR